MRLEEEETQEEGPDAGRERDKRETGQVVNVATR